MAQKVLLSQLECRALNAEKLIGTLRRQIEQIKSVALAAPAPSFEQECETLKRENEELKRQIEAQKETLVLAEKANGIQQVRI